MSNALQADTQDHEESPPPPKNIRPVVKTEAAQPEDNKQVERLAPSAGLPSDPGAEPMRAPRLLPGGFLAVGEDLERRAREWANMVRLLEQHRLHLESAEAERDGVYDKLARVVPIVQETGDALKAAMEACKAGEMSGDLATVYARNSRALDELEKIAVALSANFLWCRSAWEQYARSIVSAQRLRADIQRGPAG